MFKVGDAVYITAKVEEAGENTVGWAPNMDQYLNDGVSYEIRFVGGYYVSVSFPNGNRWAFLIECITLADEENKAKKKKRKISLSSALAGCKTRGVHTSTHNWATESTTGERKVKDGDACYSGVRYGRESPLKEILFQYKNPFSIARKTWVRHVFQFKGVQDSTLTKSYASLLKWGYKGNVEKASLSAITASAIMLREGFEFEYRALTFRKLIKSNVVPEVAYLLSSCIRPHLQRYSVACGAGHSIISEEHSLKDLLVFLKNGFVFDIQKPAKEESNRYSIFKSVAPTGLVHVLSAQLRDLLPEVELPLGYGAERKYTYKQILQGAEAITKLYNEVV